MRVLAQSIIRFKIVHALGALNFLLDVIRPKARLDIAMVLEDVILELFLLF